MYAKYKNRGCVGQTEGNRYKEITTSKAGLNTYMFKNAGWRIKNEVYKTSGVGSEQGITVRLYCKWFTERQTMQST